MCGRFYVDEGTVKEIERVIRGVDLQIQKMRTGDIYPSQPAGILTFHSRQNQSGSDSGVSNSMGFELKEMNWGFPQYQKKGLLINARGEDRPVLFMAGFYNRFQDEDRFIILTSQANASVRPVHNRMPLVLEESELEDWIYDDKFTEYALHKIPPELWREQEYEQQSLF